MVYDETFKRPMTSNEKLVQGFPSKERDEMFYELGIMIGHSISEGVEKPLKALSVYIRDKNRIKLANLVEMGYRGRGNNPFECLERGFTEAEFFLGAGWPLDV